MSHFLDFHPYALAELECITGDYEARQPGLGARFRLIIESTCTSIQGNPLLWRERKEGHRRVNLPGYPYYLAYLIDGDRILILARISHRI